MSELSKKAGLNTAQEFTVTSTTVGSRVVRKSPKSEVGKFWPKSGFSGIFHAYKPQNAPETFSGVSSVSHNLILMSLITGCPLNSI